MSKALQAWETKKDMSAFWNVLLQLMKGLLEDQTELLQPAVSDLDDAVRMIVHNDVRLLRDSQALREYEKEIHDKLAAIVKASATEKFMVAQRNLVHRIKRAIIVSSCRSWV